MISHKELVPILLRCSQLKSSSVNSFAWILCIVLQEFATVPTLYVSNSFHQYNGAVILTYTGIILIYLRCSVPALERRCMSEWSFSPTTHFGVLPHHWGLNAQWPSHKRPSQPLPLSLFSHEFIGFLMPSIMNFICSGLARTTFSNLIIPNLLI